MAEEVGMPLKNRKGELIKCDCCICWTKNKKTMKYKVGDKVRVKSLDWYIKNKNKAGNILDKYQSFVEDMSHFCGKIVTISYVTSTGSYYLEEDKFKYNWEDWMFEEDMNNEVRIEIPEGYCIDEENSTFECIKFKKKLKVHIYTTSVGVRVDTPECSFYILDKEDLVTDGYSSFKLAKLYHRDATLPSKKQCEIIYKHLNEINRFLNNKIKKVCYWISDLGESPAYQWIVYMYDGYSYNINRNNPNRVRPIINNIAWKNS